MLQINPPQVTSALAPSCGPTNEKTIVYCILAHRPRPNKVLEGNSNVECRAYFLAFNTAPDTANEQRIIKVSV